MKSFVVRVELHDAKYSDYEKLHELMKSKGYDQTIQGGSGRMFKLPPAEYVCVHKPLGFTSSQARDEVVAVAKSVKENPEVLAAEYVDIAWNLPVL